MTSGHLPPNKDKPMDPLWNTPASLNTPQMKRLRRVRLGTIAAVIGLVMAYKKIPEFEHAVDGATAVIVEHVRENIEHAFVR